MNWELSTTQMKENMQKVGGFLPMLAGLAMRALPMIAKDYSTSLGCWSLERFGWCSRQQGLKVWIVNETWWMRLHSESQ